jgi:hypothetical protein
MFKPRYTFMAVSSVISLKFAGLLNDVIILTVIIGFCSVMEIIESVRDTQLNPYVKESRANYVKYHAYMFYNSAFSFLSVKARQTFLSILNLIDFSRVYTAIKPPKFHINPYMNNAQT